MPAPLRIGTRSSPLARWQTDTVRARLAERGICSEVVPIETGGDLAREVPLARLGAPGVFSRELDSALLEHRIDLAVHSLKDLPTVPPAGIALAVVTGREDPRDAFVGRGGPMAELPAGATIGTSSLRRQAQLRRWRPDLQVADLRGNVGTRLLRLEERAEWGGIVLAVAGLVRLGRERAITERLSPALMLPAPGQGALAVTTRRGDPVSLTIRAAVDQPDVHRAVSAERALLTRVGGGCQLPVAALAVYRGGRLVLRGRILSLDGRRVSEGRMTAAAGSVAAAQALGAALAERLLARGGMAILRDLPGYLCASP